MYEGAESTYDCNPYYREINIDPIKILKNFAWGGEENRITWMYFTYTDDTVTYD